ncbi:OLC1v1006748C1 [Oldenlandia corymbosa var. corymbosa]|uniref:OLC1v1006748C1 n=1 Tax=Oldenlandia corymbosa var. corymbosa TaxID=529605 RepID=A0AAV1DIC9_OLDCO|nr:OLC1v1006748C1 [Oldenlandia corymbosa var. corymbosa]
MANNVSITFITLVFVSVAFLAFAEGSSSDGGSSTLKEYMRKFRQGSISGDVQEGRKLLYKPVSEPTPGGSESVNHEEAGIYHTASERYPDQDSYHPQEAAESAHHEAGIYVPRKPPK